LIQNGIGKEILQQFQEGKAKSDISYYILNKYDVDEYTFERNYEDFIGMLNHFNLLDNE